MNKETPIVCINLQRAKERREYIEKEWIAARGCSVHFIDAYDRREVEEGRLLYDCDPDAAVNYMKRNLTPGEIACITSHALAINYAKERQLDSVLIIEDDIEPLFKDYDELNSVLSYMSVEFPDSSIAMLQQEHLTLPYKVEEEKQYFKRVSRATYGTWSHYLNASIYDSFLEDLLSFKAPADWHWKKYCNAKQIVTPTIPLTHHIGKDTYIGNAHRGKAAYREYIE